ncbi:hypothetical protein [Owenweeksia hongkongensis]|uniref:hypothetical protein n=1 Tax=Owenweeksia hongkongensis TaxID=253245 RepID=UPI003A8ED82D
MSIKKNVPTPVDSKNEEKHTFWHKYGGTINTGISICAILLAIYGAYKEDVFFNVQMEASRPVVQIKKYKLENVIQFPNSYQFDLMLDIENLGDRHAQKINVDQHLLVYSNTDTMKIIPITDGVQTNILTKNQTAGGGAYGLRLLKHKPLVNEDTLLIPSELRNKLVLGFYVISHITYYDSYFEQYTHEVNAYQFTLVDKEIMIRLVPKAIRGRLYDTLSKQLESDVKDYSWIPY